MKSLLVLQNFTTARKSGTKWEFIYVFSDFILNTKSQHAKKCLSDDCLADEIPFVSYWNIEHIQSKVVMFLHSSFYSHLGCARVFVCACAYACARVYTLVSYNH